ncbi:unnamed protein product [Rotaria sp. Silwood1]|nr:unnamed protein product [Rotaria sp. Silwood1]
MASSTIRTYNKDQILEMINTNSSSITFRKPKHAKSVKWANYLQIFVNDSPQYFISCIKCHCILTWKPNDGTNVMDKHDKSCKQYSSSSTQQSIESFCLPNDKFKKQLINSTKRKLTNVLAECCAVDSLPFSVCRGDGFKELGNNLLKVGRQLGATVSIEEVIPDPTTISREIDKIYSARKEQLISYLSTLDHFVITVDFWTEYQTKISYGGVTLHTYSEEYGLLVFVLACKPFDLPSQTADNVRLFTDSILESYNLPLNHVKYVVCDNENKMRASFRYDINRIGCSAHFINKIIEHSLCIPNPDCEDIQRLFNSIHDLVVYLRSSHNQCKLSVKLQLFCKIKWNSAYSMLSSFINVHPELNMVINDKAQKLTFAQIDYDELISFAKYLKYFVDVTEMLSAEKTPTISLVLPLKQRLINISKPNPTDPESIMKFKKYFENKIPTYWEIDDIHFIGTVLHPKFKHLQILSNKDKKKAYELIKKEINKRNNPQSDLSFNSEVSSTQSIVISSTDTNDLLSGCYDQISTTLKASDTNDELKRYLQSIDSLIDNEDLFDFWRRQKFVYPVLYSIARDILIVPATNTAAERLFSASGNTVTETRNRLSSQKVDKLMFIKKNVAILKKIFGKIATSNNLDASVDTTAQKGEKRLYEHLLDADNNDIDNLNNSSDDEE